MTTNGNGSTNETKIRLLQRDIETIREILDKIDRTTDKVSELAQDIRRIIDLHEQRIQQIDKMMCRAKQEVSKRIDGLDEKVDSNHKIVNERIGSIEKWKWYVIGAAGSIILLLGFLFQAISIGV